MPVSLKKTARSIPAPLLEKVTCPGRQRGEPRDESLSSPARHFEQNYLLMKAFLLTFFCLPESNMSGKISIQNETESFSFFTSFVFRGRVQRCFLCKIFSLPLQPFQLSQLL